MTQKPPYFSWAGRCRGKMLIEENIPRNGARRSLISGHSEKQLATESYRMRDTSQLAEAKPPTCFRDFAGYFRSSKNKGDPVYGVTSHMLSEPVAKRRSVVPTYPVQSLRWNPYVETTSFEQLQTQEEEPKSSCNCESCCMKHCKSWVSSSSTLKSSSSHKNNIMTFSDTFTMTPQLAESGCGSSHCVPCTRDSDVSMTPSDITVRDTHGCININQYKNPASILKNCGNYQPCDDCVSYKTFCDKCDPSNRAYQEAERDTCCSDDYDKPTKVNSIKSFFKCCKKKSEPGVYRKIIYNEGISDSEPNRYHVRARADPSQVKLKKKRSRAAVRSTEPVKYDERNEPEIPHSHLSNSKYHYNCKTSQSKLYFYDQEDQSRLSENPKIIREIHYTKPAKYRHYPPIRPRRVLISEKNMDSSVEVCYQRVPCERRPKKCW